MAGGVTDELNNISDTNTKGDEWICVLVTINGLHVGKVGFTQLLSIEMVVGSSIVRYRRVTLFLKVFYPVLLLFFSILFIFFS